MFRTKTILILFILIGNYNIYSFIITPITYHKLQLTKIKKLNNLKTNNLKPGSKLLIPKV